ncbi:MAG: DUF423 domain-containing protein [Bosea sp.]|jgi:uncharacterized membrane protein YgdD (TMEM256/DUF423 family)|nr:DUF423 domain-containing protein [Bosea sp. (in: a-proteobacteria)]
MIALACRAHLAIAALFGAAGTILWASATHAAGGGSAAIGAQMLLIHAGAITALVAARSGGLLPERLASWLVSLLAFGVVLFSADLALRGLVAQRLFPMASPLGGVMMIAAWLGLALAPFLRRRA